MKKKVLILTGCLVFAGASGAVAAEGYYAGMMMGVNILSDADLTGPGISGGQIEYDSGFSGGGFFGYDMGTLRGEIELRYRAADFDQLSANGTSVATNGEFNAMSYMINGYYDFESNSPWTPYLGAGIGAATVKHKDVNIPGVVSVGDEDDTQFAYQLILGLGYSFSEKWMLNLNYRYFGTSDLEYPGNVEVEYGANNFLIGMRRNF